MPRISVIICTHNRADMLVSALESQGVQSLDRSLYEVIVVDNGSTDGTPAVVKNYQSRLQMPTTVLVREDQLGLAFARNTGFRHAQGEYVAFMDDDARADKDWLRLAMEYFERIKPVPYGVGGPILPVYEARKPAWFKDEYEIRTWGDVPRFLKRGESFSGSNMIFRRQILEAFGGFDVRVGMSGNYISVGEETELFNRMWKCGGEDSCLYYSPDLRMFHAVPKMKMTIAYQLKRAFVEGQSRYLQSEPSSRRGRWELLMRSFVSIAKQSGSAVTHLGECRTCQNWIIERAGPIAAEVGRFMGCLGLSIPLRQRP